MKHYILIIISGALLIIIGFLVSQIFGKFSSKLFVIPLKKEHFLFSDIGNFRNYYEPKPNTTETYTAPGENIAGIVSYNSDGLNERYEYEIKKQPGVFRIVTLGDSFTYGMFVSTSENYPERLEDMLNHAVCGDIKFEVINLGVPGYDVGFSVERFRRKGAKYSPDLVIWLLNPNDFIEYTDYHINIENKFKSQMTEDELIRSEQNGGVDLWEKAQESLMNTVGVDAIMVAQANYLKSFSQIYSMPLVLITRDSLRWSNYALSVIQNYSVTRPNIYVFSNLPALDSSKTFARDKHPNVNGHTMLAENIFNYLVRTDIIKCSKLSF